MFHTDIIRSPFHKAGFNCVWSKLGWTYISLLEVHHRCRVFFFELPFYNVVGDNCNDMSGCDPCGITGNWTNELGSVMKMTCQADSPTSDSGYLTGKYNSAVGIATDFYILTGRYTMSGPRHQNCMLGFSVSYNNDVRGNSNSTASFTGVYFINDDTIYTTWILASYTKYKDMWKNSNIGKNVFTRI